ncbi:MAG: DNA topoisomerase IB [Sphingobacteriales bacterium]|nr:MAG: DNA topoisomerase IB [Sphingobacteriales bacterium]
METTEIKITRRKLRSLVNDSKRSAKAINLIYVNDTQPGIRRIKTENGFIYKTGNKKIASKAELNRIKRLVIPPAWENVWICPFPNGHLQVTGTDVRGRKQYKYHPLWNNLRNHTKFTNLHDFGQILPAIRKRLQKDLSLPGLPQEKVLAAAVSVMQCTCIRVGNSMYEKLYGSFGLTTLKDQHVDITGSKVEFSFKGKKGVYHNITLKSKKLARIVQQCKDIPGKELFQYYNDNGERRSIDSGMVNNYIKQISGGSFTAKDFRTWMGTLQALGAFRQFGCRDTVTETKKKIVEALDIVAKHLGNTRTVCKKYYVHPILIDMYTNKTLERYLKDTDHANCAELTELDQEEKILMKILETKAAAVVIS